MQTHSVKLAEHRQLANTGGKKEKGKTKQQLNLPTAADSAWLRIKQRGRKKGVERRVGKEDAPCTVLLINTVQRKVQKCGSIQVCIGHVEQQ